MEYSTVPIQESGIMMNYDEYSEYWRIVACHNSACWLSHYKTWVPKAGERKLGTVEMAGSLFWDTLPQWKMGTAEAEK